MNKKILYIDMDGVIADFDGKMKEICPELYTLADFDDYEKRSDKIDEIVSQNSRFFETLNPMNGAIEAVKELFKLFDVYFLSTPMWAVPESFMGKRIWLETHFGDEAKKKLILSHRKDLAIGDFLVDDRLKNGASEFKGKHIHFGQEEFPTWKETLKYLTEFKQITYVKKDFGTVKTPFFKIDEYREGISLFMSENGYDIKNNDICNVNIVYESDFYLEIYFKFVHVSTRTSSTEDYYRINIEKPEPFNFTKYYRI